MDELDKDLLMRRIAAYLAVTIVLGFFGMFALLMFREMPGGNKDTIIQMTGALILAFGGLMGYLYGTSKGSEATQRALVANATGLVPASATGLVKIDDSTPVKVKETPP